MEKGDLQSDNTKQNGIVFPGNITSFFPKSF